jgi:hypothetical protein
MRAELKTQGLNLVGAPGFNAVTDSDGIRMQFMATPGGCCRRSSLPHA